MSDRKDNELWCEGYYRGYDHGRKDTIHEVREKVRQLCNIRQVLEWLEGIR